MGAVDFQTFLEPLGRTFFIYTVTAVAGLLDRTVPDCQEVCSPIPSSGHCLSFHPHCCVNKGQSTENLLRPLISWLTGASDPANLQLLMLSAFPIFPCSWKSSTSPAFQMTVPALPHLLPYLCKLLHSSSLCSSYSIICPTSLPYHPPFFSFILFYTNIPQHFCSFSYLQTSFLLPFSMILCQIRFHLIPFHACVTGSLISVLFSVRVLFWILSGLLLSLLASELTTNSARKKI